MYIRGLIAAVVVLCGLAGFAAPTYQEFRRELRAFYPDECHGDCKDTRQTNSVAAIGRELDAWAAALAKCPTDDPLGRKELETALVGQGSKVEIEALERPFKLYAVFPSKQSAPSVSLVGRDLRARRTGDALIIAPGDFVEFSTKPLRKDGVYRLSVTGPDGKHILNRDQIVIVDARTEKVSLQFPYSDMGTYSVTLRDIATGLETEAAVEVK